MMRARPSALPTAMRPSGSGASVFSGLGSVRMTGRTFAASLPEDQLSIIAGAGQRAVGHERHGVDVVRVFFQHPRLARPKGARAGPSCPRMRTPEMRRPGKPQARTRGPMAFEDAHGPCAPFLPDRNATVLAGSRVTSAGEHRHRVHLAQVEAQHLARHTGPSDHRIAEASKLPVNRGGPLGGHRYRAHRAAMAAQLRRARAGVYASSNATARNPCTPMRRRLFTWTDLAKTGSARQHARIR
jgi:hypothetical protein